MCYELSRINFKENNPVEMEEETPRFEFSCVDEFNLMTERTSMTFLYYLYLYLYLPLLCYYYYNSLEFKFDALWYCLDKSGRNESGEILDTTAMQFSYALSHLDQAIQHVTSTGPIRTV